jgi:hypothetical protein
MLRALALLKPESLSKATELTRSFLIIPDSAVPADAMSEEQTFRSEPSLSLRLIRLRRKWVSGDEGNDGVLECAETYYSITPLL